LKEAPGNHRGRCLTKEKVSLDNRREKRLTGWKDVDGPYPASACDTVREEIYAFFCEV
jgi:hypothetical protein